MVICQDLFSAKPYLLHLNLAEFMGSLLSISYLSFSAIFFFPERAVYNVATTAPMIDDLFFKVLAC